MSSQLGNVLSQADGICRVAESRVWHKKTSADFAPVSASSQRHHHFALSVQLWTSETPKKNPNCNRHGSEQAQTGKVWAFHPALKDYRLLLLFMKRAVSLLQSALPPALRLSQTSPVPRYARTDGRPLWEGITANPPRGKARREVSNKTKTWENWESHGSSLVRWKSECYER